MVSLVFVFYTIDHAEEFKVRSRTWPICQYRMDCVRNRL